MTKTNQHIQDSLFSFFPSFLVFRQITIILLVLGLFFLRKIRMDRVKKQDADEKDINHIHISALMPSKAIQGLAFAPFFLSCLTCLTSCFPSGLSSIKGFSSLR